MDLQDKMMQFGWDKNPIANGNHTLAGKNTFECNMCFGTFESYHKVTVSQVDFCNACYNKCPKQCMSAKTGKPLCVCFCGNRWDKTCASGNPTEHFYCFVRTEDEAELERHLKSK